MIPSSSEAKAARLKTLRKLLGLTQEKLCKVADLNLVTYQGWERGKYGGLSKPGAKKLVEFYQSQKIACFESWLLEGIGPNPMVEAKTSEYTSDEISQIAEEIQTFRAQGNTLDMIVYGNEMAPEYINGDYIAGAIMPLRKCINRVCIIAKKKESICRLVKMDKNNQLMLVALDVTETINPIEPAKDVISMAPVLWRRRQISAT